ncbi:hypothetical protein NE237_031664 [Protea cynaroides]|uniref:Uncharacterized protein n=1 Tax=Protea cynaroides TaxID=273540 RepID=A0A9Q0L1M0_9MAGN|nr:hypothetical protein NE237_031664 [Protea cynaroides]
MECAQTAENTRDGAIETRCLFFEKNESLRREWDNLMVELTDTKDHAADKTRANGEKRRADNENKRADELKSKQEAEKDKNKDLAATFERLRGELQEVKASIPRLVEKDVDDFKKSKNIEAYVIEAPEMEDFCLCFCSRHYFDGAMNFSQFVRKKVLPDADFSRFLEGLFYIAPLQHTFLNRIRNVSIEQDRLAAKVTRLEEELNFPYIDRLSYDATYNRLARSEGQYAMAHRLHIETCTELVQLRGEVGEPKKESTTNHHLRVSTELRFDRMAEKLTKAKKKPAKSMGYKRG